MSVAFGKIEYRIDDPQIIACGVSHTDKEMFNALTNEVYDKVYDITGNSDLIDSILIGLADTGFKKIHCCLFLHVTIALTIGKLEKLMLKHI